MNGMATLRIAALAVTMAALVSCATTSNPKTERGPDGTIVYEVPVDSSEPGAQIEVNGETVGATPMILKIFGDRDGTFHSFGSYDFIVRAYRPGGGRPALTKVYRTGALFAVDDKIPDKIYFDFGPKSAPSTP